MSKSPVRWVSDAQWKDMSVPERALQVAAQECDVFKVKEFGNNRGPRIREYLASVGLSEGFPWCAAFVSFCLKEAGYTAFKSAAVRNWAEFAANDHGLTVQPQRGDLFFWLNKGGQTGHIGFVVRVGTLFVETIEGNTDAEGSREGDGVYRRKRLKAKLRFIRL